MADDLSCTEIEELLALAALGVLPSADSAVVGRHLEHCAACRRTASAFQRTAAALPESLDLLQPPAALRRSLLTAVYSTSGARRRRPSNIVRDAWRRIPRARAYAVVAVGAVAAAVVLGVVTATRSNPAPAQAETFAVIPATAYPAASGELVYDPATTSSVLTVHGLPDLASAGTQAGRVYEVWLIPAGGQPVPAAFLSPPPMGANWTAVLTGDVLRYRSVAATVEPAGGTRVPTGAQMFSISLAR